MKNTRLLSDTQATLANVLGLDVDGELVVLNPFLAGEQKVWDRDKDERRPVLIRVVNVGTEKVFWSENLGQCTAAQYNDVLQGDTTGAPIGDGEAIEFRAHIPKNIYLFAAANAAVRVTKRYAM